MGDLGNVIAASTAGGKEDNAAVQAGKATQRTNLMNLYESLYARGADLSKLTFPKQMGIPSGLLTRGGVIFPQYGADKERALFDQAAQLSAAIAAQNGTPEAQGQIYQALLDKYGPDFANNDQLASDLASGRLTTQMLTEAQPVEAARLGVAEGQKNAGLEAIKQTLNNIDTIQARKGYSGDSSGSRQLEFNARRAVNTSGADAINMALLQNEMEKMGIKTAGRGLQLSNINLPDTLLRSAVSRRQLPGQAMNQAFTQRTAPFSLWNQNPMQFRGAERPPVMPRGAGLGEILGSVGGAAGSNLTNYFLREGMKGFGAGGGNPNSVTGPGGETYYQMQGNAGPAYTNYPNLGAADAGSAAFGGMTIDDAIASGAW